MKKYLGYLISGAILFIYYSVMSIVNFTSANELYGLAYATGAVIVILLTCIEILLDDVKELKQQVKQLQDKQ